MAVKKQDWSEIGLQLEKCSFCGLCPIVCPTFEVTNNDAESPRGRVIILRALISGHISPASAAKRLHSCLICGKCAKICPAEIRLDRIFEKALLLLPSMTTPRKWQIFAHFCSFPKLANMLQPAIGLSLGYLPESCTCHVPPLAPKPFTVKSSHSDIYLPGRTILFFVGCISRRIYPQIADASLFAMQQHGYKVYMPEKLVCCGRPSLAAGNKRAFLRNLKRNLQIFARHKFDYIVTVCPACHKTLSELHLFYNGLSLEEKKLAEQIAAKLVDVNQLLHSALKKSDPVYDNITNDNEIFWHKPCLLDESSNSAAKFVAFGTDDANPKSAQVKCCGSPCPTQAGSMAKMVANEARDKFIADGAKIIATACPSCILRLNETFAAHKDSVTVLHGVELYAHRLKTRENRD